MSRTFSTRVPVAASAIANASLLIALLATHPVNGQTTESSPAPAAAAVEPAAPKIPNDQLDSLVAPIALYPDPLLAQILAASTYPLEIAQLEQWLKRNPDLKQDALAEAVAKQTWDTSVQALAIFPEVVVRLSENIGWTMDLGNAFLAQQSGVMAAVQRMRAKAQNKGTLKTSEQQTVEKETVEGGVEFITIEPANPQYAYVPNYDMTVVYGAPIYPYPYYYYPGYGSGAGLAFGTGIILGAAWANHWGDCNWGHGDVTINNKNNFNRNNINNIQGGNRNQAGGGGKWQHNPTHRGGAPYGDRATAGKYGGRARQQPAGGTGNRAGGGSLGGNRAGGSSLAGNRAGSGAGGVGSGNRAGGSGGGAGNLGGIGPNRADGGSVFSGGNRPGADGGRGGSVGDNAFQNNAFGDRAGAGGNREGASVSNRAGNRGGGGGGGGHAIGNRSISGGGGFGSSSSVFGDGGFGGSSARSASNRGGYSMGGGGYSRGGGGGGGFRGGGGGGMRGGGGGRRR